MKLTDEQLDGFLLAIDWTAQTDLTVDYARSIVAELRTLRRKQACIGSLRGYSVAEFTDEISEPRPADALYQAAKEGLTTVAQADYIDYLQGYIDNDPEELT